MVNAGDINFGALAGGWGLASSNNAGLPWNLLKNAVQVLLGNNTASPAPKYSKGWVYGPPGGNKGYGEIYTGGTPYSANTLPAKYILDISEIPFAPAHYRVSGPIISASQLISQVCQDAGCDYYVELLPTAAALVIKVRVIVRTNQPAMGEIDAFITSSVGVSTSNTIGKEYRPDPNNAFIIGDKKRSLYRHTGVNTTGDLRSIQPYWGRDLDGNLNPSYENTCEIGDTGNPAHWLGPPDWNVRLDFREIDGMLNHQISSPAPFTAYKKLLPDGKGWVWEGELRAALGDFQSFVNFLIGPDPYCNPPYVDRAKSDPTVLRLWARDISLVYQNRLGGGIPANATQQFMQGINVRVGTRGPTGAGSLPIKDAQKVHKWLQKYAQEHYGRKWLVEIPFVCYAGDTGNPNQILWSDEPSTEGAWAQPSLDSISPALGDVPEVLGLLNEVGRGSVAIDRFKTDDGRVEPILRWAQNRPHGAPCLRNPCVTGLDYSQVPIAQMVTDTFNYTAAGQGDLYVWQRAEIDDAWVTGSPYVGSEQNRAFALLTCDPVVTGFPLNEGTRAPESFVVRSGIRDSAGAMMLVGITGASGISRRAGQFADRMLSPTAAAVPILSNTQTYGPWFKEGIEYGTVYAEQDTSLSPWEYGGQNFMDLGAISKVHNATTEMNIAERGEVTVAGYPTKGLGAGITSTITLYAARTLSTANFGGLAFNFVPLASSASSASVSNINVVVSPQGVTTSYTMTTFTPVFGRFSKNNAERIKQIGSAKLKSEKANRKREAKALLNRLSGASTRANVMLQSLVAGPSYAQNSPGVLLVGSLMPTDKRRKEVAIANKNTLSFYGNYQNTAMMSIDGLIRPVSKSGDAGLPSMKAYTDTFCPIGTGVIGTATSFDNLIASGASGMASGTYSGFDAEASSYKNVNAPVAPPPPIPYASGIIIAANYLDPFADPKSNSTFTASPRATGSLGTGTGGAPIFGSGTNASGHDIESVARGTLEGLARLPSGMWSGESMMIAGDSGRYAAGQDLTFPPNYDGSGDCRFMALRGPLVLQSWGYDTYGKPVPNSKGWSGDPSFDSGNPQPADTGNIHQRNQSGLTDRFAPNWLGDATNWPVAPVDLRYDRVRGVWTSPQPFRLMKAQAIEAIEAGGTGTLEVLSGGDMYDENGQPFSGIVTNQPTGTGGVGETGIVTGLPPLFRAVSEGAISKDDIVLTHYDTYSCEHWVIAGGGGAGSGFDGIIPGIGDFVCEGDVIQSTTYDMHFAGGLLVGTG